MTVVTEAEEAAATAARENFTKLSVLNANKSVRFLSNQAVIVLSTAKSVFKNKRADANRYVDYAVRTKLKFFQS
jgi:hypothetical protein